MKIDGPKLKALHRQRVASRPKPMSPELARAKAKEQQQRSIDSALESLSQRLQETAGSSGPIGVYSGRRRDPVYRAVCDALAEAGIRFKEKSYGPWFSGDADILVYFD